MKLQDFTGPIDLDLTLRDASLNPDVRPTRRAIAAASIGIEPEDAYYSVRELREACEWIHEGDPAGKAKLAQMLGNRCDDYQRCIYYNLAGRGVCVLIDDLLWLEALLAFCAWRGVLRWRICTQPLWPEALPQFCTWRGGL